MDAADFDRLTKTLSGAGTRRRLVRLLTALPLGVTLAALLGDTPETTAKKKKQRHDGDDGSSHRRQRRKARHRHQTGDHKENRKGERKGKGKGKGKSKKACATAGLTPNQGTRTGCCAGLSPDGSGRCAAPAPPPPPPPPPPGCTGLKPTDTSPTQTQGLQEAIEDADEGSTLTLCAGTWKLGATLSIGKKLTLVGAGAGQTVLDGQEAVRVLKTTSVPQPGVVLQDLTITRRDASGVNSFGGGINNDGGTLTLSGVDVTGNTAGHSGGGIHNEEGTLTLRDGSRVSGNTADLHGGGIRSNQGALTLEAGTIIGGDTPADANTATNQNGGGIFNWFGGAVTLRNGSRVVGNTAGSVGGGIYNEVGTLTFEAGSIIGGDTPADANTAGRNGGGIYTRFSPSTVTLQDGSRVVGNIGFTSGGGIYNGGGSVTLQGVDDPSLIVVDNCVDNCAGSTVAKCAPPPVSCP